MKNFYHKNQKVIDKTLSFEFTKDDLQSSRINIDSILEDFGFSYKIDSKTQTAYRIFHSKIGKLIFRRKMSAFFCSCCYLQSLAGFGLFSRTFSISSITANVNLGTKLSDWKFSTTCDTLDAPVMTLEQLLFFKHQAIAS